MPRLRDKDLRLSITAVLLLTLVGLRPLDARSTAKNSQQSRAFTEALAEARRLSDTEAGKAYQGEFGKMVAPRLGDIVGECTKNLGPTVKFQVVFVFAANGRLEQVLGGPKDQPAAKCVGDKFRDLQLPAPPHANWPVSLSIDISPENAPRLLAEALKLMETGTWEVDVTISRAFKFRVHGLLAGQDFDLTVEPEDRNAFRVIAIKGQLWTSFDGSKTWKLEDAKGDAVAQRFYGFVHYPLRSEAVSPALQVVKQETHDGDTWMQLRPKKSDKKKAELQQTEYWIAISQDAKRNGVRHYEGPVTEPGHEKEPLHCVATYQPTNDKTIQPPANPVAQIKDETNAAESPSPAADNTPRSGSLTSAAGASASSTSPANEESVADLVNGGIEKAKDGDLDGAIADFDRAIEIDPKDDAPYFNRAQAKWQKKDAAGAIADYTRAIELGSTNPAAYNNRGNARAENNDRDGAIADYTRAIELRPDYARAYYNRSMAKEAKGDKAGAEADFKTAAKLDPELDNEQSTADSKDNRPSRATTVSLLDGKLKFEIPSDFSRDPGDPKEPKTVARFSGPDGAWGEVLRGTHGLTPEDLPGYLKKRVDEYSKGFKWLPKDSHLQWLKKDIVTINGRKWADWRFVPMLKGGKDYQKNPVYTRFLTTSYKGQLLEVTFTSNLNAKSELKEEINHIMDSVHLEE
jgi:tetratricopeptide (TPR) repeat protein